ncbi:hypothetical protein BGZ91_012197, partial [Linnemannia elongata]
MASQKNLLEYRVPDVTEGSSHNPQAGAPSPDSTLRSSKDGATKVVSHVTLIKADVDAILNAFPGPVVLIRCYFPFYDSVDLERRVIIEHAVVEFFRSPWQPKWEHRVRSALVQNPGSWFKSVTGKEDEVFLVPNQMPAAAVSPLDLYHLMEVDPQPPSTAAGSADTASLQGNAVTHPFWFPPLPDKPSYYESMDTDAEEDLNDDIVTYSQELAEDCPNAWPEDEPVGTITESGSNA